MFLDRELLFSGSTEGGYLTVAKGVPGIELAPRISSDTGRELL